jgi:branched-chain amino acid transport system permease protein
MALAGAWVERFVMRPLVNQPDIILFMATIGLTYFLIGLRRIDLRWRAEEDDRRRAGPADRIDGIRADGGIVIMQHLDVAAVVMAVVWSRCLAVFFNKTRIGRALRAVADDHQAALSVGISLNQIWAIVWFAAGIVALTTGIMWGAKSDVSFALQIIALKALPVLIIGGFTSIPGAIIGGLIIGIGEKLFEIYWGGAARQRHRGLVRLHDCTDLPAVQAARAVRRTHYRKGVSDAQEQTFSHRRRLSHRPYRACSQFLVAASGSAVAH